MGLWMGYALGPYAAGTGHIHGLGDKPARQVRLTLAPMDGQNSGLRRGHEDRPASAGIKSDEGSGSPQQHGGAASAALLMRTPPLPLCIAGAGGTNAAAAGGNGAQMATLPPSVMARFGGSNV